MSRSVSLPGLVVLLWLLALGGVGEASGERDRHLEEAYQAFEEATPWLETGRADDARRAVDVLEPILSVFRRAGMPAAESEVLYALGIARSELGERDLALALYQRALDLQQALGDVRGEAATLNNIGLIHAEDGRPATAFHHLETALALRRADSDRAGEAATAHNLAALHVEVGELQAGLELYRRALALHRQLDDSEATASTLNNLGLVLVELGEPEKALARYRRALDQHRASGNVRGEAGTLSNIGLAHFELDRYAPALALLAAALERYRHAGDRSGVAGVLNNLGMVHLEAGQLEGAAGHLEAALTAHRQSRDIRGEAAVLHNLGQLFREKGLDSRAESFLGQALEFQRQVGDLSGSSLTLLELARLFRDRAQPERAVAMIAEAVEIAESVRADVLSPSYRMSLAGKRRELYEVHVDLLMTLARKRPEDGHAAAALTVAERARARSLLDLLGETKARIRHDVDLALLTVERELRRRLSARANLHRRLLQQGDDQGAERLGEELEALLDDTRRHDERIRLHSPRYAELIRPEPLSAEAIRQLLDERTVLLEYSLGEPRSYLWAVTRRGITGWELAGRDRIETAARRLHKLLSHGRERGFQGPARVAATELAELVLRPAASELGDRRVVVVPDGGLELAPFALLPIEGRPLGQDREVIAVPSASVLASIRRRSATVATPSRKTLAILADPVFEASDPRLAESREMPAPVSQGVPPPSPLDAVEPLPRLVHSRLEAERIAALVPEEQRLLALGPAARRELVIAGELAPFRIVHFATHGILDAERPELSALVLSRHDARGRAVDGYLRLLDVYNLRLDADLVVLSACRTALGKAVTGEGLVGLTRGFLYAGARQVLVSLWNVDDEATAVLMEHFYRGLLVDGRPAAAALRDARRKLAADPRWRSPYYWAAFVLQGDWR